MDDMAAAFVYITAPEKDRALALGRTLVEEHLAACVNVLDGMTSIYRWQGRIEQAQEAALIAKTRDDLVERLTARVRELHEYECPCVVAWPVSPGNPDYMRWIESESGEDGGSANQECRTKSEDGRMKN
jgi:periplasmic divalent cation tolerance protein